MAEPADAEAVSLIDDQPVVDNPHSGDPKVQSEFIGNVLGITLGQIAFMTLVGAGVRALITYLKLRRHFEFLVYGFGIAASLTLIVAACASKSITTPPGNYMYLYTFSMFLATSMGALMIEGVMMLTVMGLWFTVYASLWFCQKRLDMDLTGWKSLLMIPSILVVCGSLLLPALSPLVKSDIQWLIMKSVGFSFLLSFIVFLMLQLIANGSLGEHLTKNDYVAAATLQYSYTFIMTIYFVVAVVSYMPKR